MGLNERNKLFLISALGIFLLFIVIAILVLEKESISESVSQITPESVQVPTPLAGQVTDRKEISVIAPKSASGAPYKWSQYEGKSYTFQYPPDWSIQSTPVAGGGEVIVAKPLALPAGINYPQFILQTQPVAADVIERKEGILLGLGFTQTSEKLNEIQAKKFTGTIPFKAVGTQTVNEPLQDTTYLIKKDDMIYVLKYEYEGAVLNDLLEDFFYGFSHSFKFK